MLIVVDVQTNFRAAWSVVKQVNRECVEAQDRGEHIIFLEWYNHGSTIEEVKAGLEPEDYSTIIKYSDNGSGLIFDFLRKEQKEHIRDFRVCGVNGACCVKDTVMGILQSPKRIKKNRVVVAAQATCCQYETYWIDDVVSLAKYLAVSRRLTVEGRAAKYFPEKYQNQPPKCFSEQTWNF